MSAGDDDVLDHTRHGETQSANDELQQASEGAPPNEHREMESSFDQRQDNHEFDPYKDASFDIQDDWAGQPGSDGPEGETVEMSGVAVNRPEESHRSSSPLVGWALLLLVLGSLIAIVVFAPQTMIRVLPGAAPVYQALGFNVNARGLDFSNVTYDIVYEGGGGQLEISGEITNLTSQRINTPTVVFSLRDAEGGEVQQYTANVFTRPLEPGETAPFAARMPEPGPSVRSVEVRFASES